MTELPEKKLLRVDEVAVYLSVSERTVRYWVKKGVLKAVRIASTIRVLRESVIEKAK